jgi:hypothetical protein
VPGFLATVALRNVPQDLTPASGGQDNTISSSANGTLVSRAGNVHRIPLPAFRDDRDPPLVPGRDAGETTIYFCKTEAVYFSQADLTLPDMTSGKTN